MSVSFNWVAQQKAGLRRIALLAGVALLSTLSACGGDGGSSGGGGTVVTPPSPTPSPTPTPTPTGSLAVFTEGKIPGLQGADLVLDFQVTNRGLYMRVVRESATARGAIIKLHGDPRVSEAWTITEPEGAAGATILSYAPSNISSESDQTVCFYYAALDGSAEKSLIWARYNATPESVPIRTTETPSTTTIPHVAPGAGSSCSASRAWIIYQTATEDQVRQEDGVYTEANTILDRFGRAATPSLARGASRVMVSHPVDPQLYVGAGNQLSLYEARRLLNSWSFPEGAIGFTDLIWYGSDLFIGYGSQIYRLSGTTLELFADNVAAGEGAQRGRFCVTQGEVFLPNGEAIDVQTKTKRNWISKGELSSAQTATAQTLVGSLNSGVYCSAVNPNATIYTPAARDQIRVITPVSR
jgi:hypothetical protein